jgi:hypothetical protein
LGGVSVHNVNSRFKTYSAFPMADRYKRQRRK